MEFEVMSQDSDRSDLFGRAISLDGGLLLAGAPKKHRDVPEVQLIVSSGTASEVGNITHLPCSWVGLGTTYLGVRIKSWTTHNNRHDNAHKGVYLHWRRARRAVGIDNHGTLVLQQTDL